MSGTAGAGRAFGHFLSAYGMLAVLALLCAFFAWRTYGEEFPTGREAAEVLASSLEGSVERGAGIVIVSQTDASEAEFAEALHEELGGRGFTVTASLQGDPPTVREGLERVVREGGRVDVVATTSACVTWKLFDAVKRDVPALAGLRVLSPPSRKRSTFLSPTNLRNVADQIAVIAIIAVGMTMVILTGGIDLSVGSVVAMSAVVTAWLIREAGGASASPLAMLGCCLAAVALAGAVGAFSGGMVTLFRIPPFIATLAMMQVASGLAFIVAKGQSIYDIPASFTWLGRGADLVSIPNAVVLMGIVYALAHVLMTRVRLGRHIYAVGGNAEAARLSGVPVRRVLLFVYLASGVMAGLGGVITASQLKAGAPTYGLMYELYVIAAVVVGGTSLSGGEGRILGTLIGAFIIAVIRNGMNLMNVEAYEQKVVLGLVILGAVLLDQLKRMKLKQG